MNGTKTRYAYEKRIRELEQENCKLSNDLYSYRQTVLEIFEGITSMENLGNGLKVTWVLQRLRRCLK